MSAIQNVCVLGSTGSIGVNTLDVISQHKDRYRVFALSAHSNDELLSQQCLEFNPAYAVMSDEYGASRLRDRLQNIGCDTEVLSGQKAQEQIASANEVDSVMAAIVGGAGLLPTLAAAKAGKKILLANKEALVMAGSLFTEAVRESGAQVLPIDSEHNAIFQCLPVSEKAQFVQEREQGFEKILLTASGGPFLNASAEMLKNATPDQACAHPNWDMGRKISVDSATLLNKSLELIEACYLFQVEESQVEIVIHPQSIIHSLVRYIDGSVLAQLGNPDMRTPIAYGLAWPERIASGVAPLDLIQIAKLDFLEPDLSKFPCLSLGRQAAQALGSAPLILNAANEIAVKAFLAGQVGFQQIPAIISAALDALTVVKVTDLDSVLELDARARTFSELQISKML